MTAKKYSVSHARTHLPVLIAQAAHGAEVEIEVFDQPYIRMTRQVADDGGTPALVIGSTDARDNWSQLLSAVARTNARFAFTSTDGSLVHLRKSDDYVNPFVERWNQHIATQKGSLTPERVAGALSVLGNVSRELETLQRLVTLARTTLQTPE